MSTPFSESRNKVEADGHVLLGYGTWSDQILTVSHLARQQPTPVKLQIVEIKLKYKHDERNR